MLKRILLIIIFLFYYGSCFAFSDDELNKIEFQKYGQVFVLDSLADRLNRLETDFFGMAQTGNIEDRVNRLVQISQNSKHATFNSPYNYPSSKDNKFKNFWNSAAEFFGSGTMTGFTPSFNSPVYGYSDVIYQNELDDFFNNSYCPYQNRYNNPYYGGYFPNSGYIPSYQSTTYGRNFPINNNYHQSYYLPPNMQTRSSVHIIRD